MYQLRSPSPALSRFIEYYWFVGAAGPEPSDLRVDVFVDGRADLIFNYGAPYLRGVIGAGRVEIAHSNFDAQRLIPIRIAQHGLVRTTGVRFRLGGVAPFACTSLHHFTDATPHPWEVLGPEARGLEEGLKAHLDEDAQARLLDDFFSAKFRTSEAHGRFERALRHADETRGAADLDALGVAAGASNRHVERMFQRFLGISPRALARVLRFQTALRALMRDPGCTLAEVAAAAGYFDQAHFVREFKKMTGGVPRGYRGYFPAESPSDFCPQRGRVHTRRHARTAVQPGVRGASRHSWTPWARSNLNTTRRTTACG